MLTLSSGYFFSSTVSIWFFISFVYLLRLLTFPFISRMFPPTLCNIFYSNCFEVLADSNSCVVLALASLLSSPMQVEDFPDFFVCLVIWDWFWIFQILLYETTNLNLDSKFLLAFCGFLYHLCFQSLHGALLICSLHATA